MSHLRTDVLNDFLDGELAPVDAARVRAHLAACDACRAEAEALRAVIARVRALPRSVAPPRDLRPRRRAAAGRRTFRRAALLAAAAALVMALGATLRHAGTNETPPAASAVPSLAWGEPRYQAVVVELSVLLRARRERLPAGVAAGIDQTLAEIDRTLEQSRQALQGSPGNVDAELAVSAAYAHKIELLHHALELTTSE